MGIIPSFKLLVTYHKPATLLNAENIIPIHVGRSLAKRSVLDGNLSAEDLRWLENNMIGDDTGDNISRLNDSLKQMTAIYWAWKNYDELGNPDWIGFTHYRRHFIANPRDNKTVFQEFDFMDSKYLEKICYEHLQKLLTGIDFVAINETTLNNSIYQEYKNSPDHKIEDLNLCLSIIGQKYPEMLELANKYIHGNKLSYCNMFIMKKEVFFAYAEWIFNVLFELLQQKTTEGRVSAEKRNFYSEYLTGIYLRYLKKTYKYISLPTTLILNTDLPQEIYPGFAGDGLSIVFVSNDAFIPYLATSIYSLIEQSSQNRCYDIFILDNNISQENKGVLKKLEKENISIRFISVIPYLNKIDVSLIQLHKDFTYYTHDTYYRFLIPTIFKNFKKIIYLDGDTVILKDISQLYDIELGDNLIAATKDLYMPLWRKNEAAMEKYLKNQLQLANPDGYFQAGVLIFNVEKMITLNSQGEFFNTIKRLGRPWLQDQDILNFVTQGRVLYLNGRWNFDRNIEDFAKIHLQVFSKVYQGNILSEYEKIKSDPFIIHFAGPSKPWKDPNVSYASFFWEFARQTPFYEKILFNSIIGHCNSNLKNFQGISRWLSLLKKIILIIRNEGIVALVKKCTVPNKNCDKSK